MALDKTKLYYLGAPFSHADANVRTERLQRVNQYAARLLQEGYCIYSPMTHHAGLMNAGLMPESFTQWERSDGEIFRRCDGLIVLRLLGWEQSVGLGKEMQWAEKYGKEIIFHDWV